MTDRHTFWRALGLTVLVWLIFSWPLPIHLDSTVPSASVKPVRSVDIQPMRAGDHLQLDYHFWLLSDMIAGKTPWFYNLYEFNMGDDAERFDLAPYYVPFSIFYSVGTWLGSRAFAWNLTGFLSLWLTAYFTFLLARRYAPKPAAWLGAAAAIMFPYRWINITGGSPTGFGMAWVPLLLYGLDVAVRDSKARGGIAAGLAILMAAWGDPHTFFFAVLATPCWCIFAFVQRPDFEWKLPRAYGRLALALAPVALFAAAAYLTSKSTSSQVEGAKSSVRMLKEVAIYSPEAEGLWSWADLGISNHIYLGIVPVGIALAALVLGFRENRRRPAWWLTWLMIGAAVIVVIELSLGPNGVHGGYFFRLARRVVPPYGIIRQPAKVYGLMPSLVALAIALGASYFRSPRQAAVLLGGLLLVEWRLQGQPLLERLEKRQGAYEAVAQSAPRPHALVLPLWPGDSHQTSVYQYYASLYRLRLVNGYRPFVSKGYIDTMFHGFESMNQGLMSDAQADDLLERGITFILLHEDMFPEKVSPFPVGFTLAHLVAHARLSLIDQDGPVWAFRILPVVEARREAPAWVAHFPARRIEWEVQGGADPTYDEAASERCSVTITPGKTVIARRPVASAWAPGLRWVFRVRGHGGIAIAAGGATNALAVDSDSWTWRDMPLGEAYEGERDMRLALTGIDGQVVVDVSLLTAGAWRDLEPGQSVSLPAAGFFHAGRTVAESGGVALSTRDGSGPLFYGPRLPMAPGRYRVVTDIASAAAPATELGTLVFMHEGGREIKQASVNTGANAVTLHVDSNLPFVLVFVYNAAADCEIRSVSIERLANQQQETSNQ